jgi:stearoyl-CoA 9-desaturase NADPH oxidoreductase
VTTTATPPRPTARQGWLPRLITPLVDPNTFDFWARHINPTWSWDRPLARVVERSLEAQDTVTLVLAPNHIQLELGLPQPGQHINVSTDVNGRRVTRSYSITNVPGPEGHLAITVKRTPAGVLSQHLFNHIQVGSVLELSAPFGAMTLPEQPTGRYLFLAAGSGITPLISLTRSLARQGMPVDLKLVYWARTREDLCFVNELRELAAHQHRFKLQIVLTHEHELQQGEAEGLICAEQINTFAPDIALRNVLACGPGGFVETARQLTAGLARQFVAEGFTPSAPPAQADGPATTIQVHLRKSGKHVLVSTGESLLTALEAQGLNPAHGCRMGICHTCVCTRHSGATVDTLTGQRDQTDNSAVRLCVSRAATDIELDL